MTPTPADDDRADSTGLKSRADARLSLWVRAHVAPIRAGYIGAVMMALAALIGVAWLVWIITHGV